MDGLKSIFAEQNRAWIFIICGLFLIFFINLAAPTDPDFGWHLRIGQDLLTNRSLPHFDPYSFTMSDFPWISYSWLADIIIAFTEKYFGLFALSVFFAAVAAASFFLAAKAIKAGAHTQIIAALFGSVLSVSVISIRPHVFSALGLSFLVFILLRWRQNSQIYPERRGAKMLWWLPLLFIIWSNLHPGFAIGLVLFLVFILAGAIFALAKIAPKLPFLKNLLLIFLFSSAATFVNPYGPKIWEEIFRTAADFYGRSQIIEWQPLFNADAQVFLPTLIFAALLFGSQFFSKKRDLILITISALFFIFSLLAWRNLPLFFIASAPLTLLTIENFAGKELLNLMKLPVILLTVFVITIYFGSQNIKEVWLTDLNPAALARQTQSPIDAIQFLKTNRLSLADDRLFNDFNWGGYILWQLPGQKVFIDGRMPHWQLPEKHIFADYIELQKAQNIQLTDSLIQKYNLNIALIRSDSPLALRLSFSGWQKIYEDDVSVILKK